MEDQDFWVRLGAAKALRVYPAHREALPSLAAMAQRDEEDAVRCEALRALPKYCPLDPGLVRDVLRRAASRAGTSSSLVARELLEKLTEGRECRGDHTELQGQARDQAGLRMLSL